jgi:hypothetical protein
MSTRGSATLRHSSVPTQALASRGVNTMWFRDETICGKPKALERRATEQL